MLANRDNTSAMTTFCAKGFRLDDRILPRVLPFGLFMLFIAVEEAIRACTQWGWVHLPEAAPYYLYPLKTFAVAVVLVKYLGRCREFRIQDLWRTKTSLAVCAVGIATFLLWISMDWMVSVAGTPKGFNPSLLPGGPVRSLMTVIRVAGAVVVVPLMEELFWRSFLLRYLVDADFDSVRLGTFTWPSFLITTVLFGLEHNLIVAGMVAGAIFNIILYKTRSLAQCVFAHAVTNLALACYVLYTGKWYFW